MSLAYWVCQGIGFEQSAVIPLLDAAKLEKLINEKAENLIVNDAFKTDYDFEQKDNDAKVKLLLEEIVCDEDLELAGLLATANEEEVLIAITDGDGSYFLLYPPRYPWEYTGDFLSQETLIEYIAFHVLAFCRDDVSMQDVIAIIDPEIHEVGCG